MKFKINGRRYHIKENIKIKLDGFVLIFLAYLCVRTGAGGAAFFMGLWEYVFCFHSQNLGSAAFYTALLKRLLSMKMKNRNVNRLDWKNTGKGVVS